MGRDAQLEIIAEVGLSHDGSLRHAITLGQACLDAGADTVKYQDHLGDENAKFRGGTWFPQDQNRQDYWRRTLFRLEEWHALRWAIVCHAQRYDAYLCTPFSVAAVQQQEPLALRWKIGSAQANADNPVLQACDATCLPLMVSTGLCSVDEAARIFRKCEVETVFHCTTQYPTPLSEAHLQRVQQFAGRFGDGCRIGYSCHVEHQDIEAACLAAYRYGARVFELHTCFSRRQQHPDWQCSVTVEELESTIRKLRQLDALERGRLHGSTADEKVQESVRREWM